MRLGGAGRDSHRACADRHIKVAKPLRHRTAIWKAFQGELAVHDQHDISGHLAVCLADHLRLVATTPSQREIGVCESDDLPVTRPLKADQLRFLYHPVEDIPRQGSGSQRLDDGQLVVFEN